MLTTELLTSLAAGDITFNEFATKTHGDFTALATSVANRWGKLPLTLQLDDLRQEMLLSVHISLPDHNPARGGIRKFIVFCACSAARKELYRHVQSKRRDGHSVFKDVQEPVQEAALLAHQLLGLLPIGDRQYRIIQSLARTDSFADTAEELLADPLTRSMFITPQPKAARLSVLRTARKLAQRAQAIA